MRPYPREYDRAIRSGAKLVSEAHLLHGGQPTGTVLPVLGGSWNLDTKAAIRRRASFTVGAEDLSAFVPAADWRADRSGLWPIGNEVLLKCGVVLPTGDRVLFDCGVYRVSAPTATRPVNGGVAVSVNLFDRARAVSRSRLLEPLSTADKNLTVPDAIRRILELTVSFLGPDDFGGFMTSDYLTPGLVYLMTDDPWAAAQALAVGIGAELYFDGSGKPVLAPVRDIVDVDYTYRAEADGVLLGGSRALDDESAVSGVILTATNSSLPGPLWAEAWDLNPASPTYYDPAHPERSTYGRVVGDVQSQTVANSEQAQTAADAALRTYGGLLEKVTIEGLVNYAHDGGDVLGIELDDVGIDSVYVVDTIAAPLTADGTLALGTRARKAA